MRTRLTTSLSFLLVAGLGTATAADDPSPEVRYKVVLKELTKAQNNYVSLLYRARSLKQAREAYAHKPGNAEYAGKFLEIARKGPASDSGLDAIFWVLANCPGAPASDEAYGILARDYLDHKRILIAIRGVVSWPTREAEDFLRAAMEKSKLDLVRADACNTLGAVVVARTRRQAGTAAGKASFDEAQALFKKLGSDYGSMSVGSTTYGDLSRLALAKLGPKPKDGEPGPRVEEGVLVGKKAPEVAATNSDGEATRLSGYEGSVVVLAFWAGWCPWCHDIYPFGRDLKYRTGGKPFVLLGVNYDGSPERLREVMAAEGIIWPSWWDAGKQIFGRYQIERFPTTLVLDHRGVVRYKIDGATDEESLTRAVRELQEEQARDPNPITKARPQENKPETPKKRVRKKIMQNSIF
jgi:peroxiredoxin